MGLDEQRWKKEGQKAAHTLLLLGQGPYKRTGDRDELETFPFRLAGHPGTPVEQDKCLPSPKFFLRYPTSLKLKAFSQYFYTTIKGKMDTI